MAALASLGGAFLFLPHHWWGLWGLSLKTEQVAVSSERTRPPGSWPVASLGEFWNILFTLKAKPFYFLRDLVKTIFLIWFYTEWLNKKFYPKRKKYINAEMKSKDHLVSQLNIWKLRLRKDMCLQGCVIRIDQDTFFPKKIFLPLLLCRFLGQFHSVASFLSFHYVFSSTQTFFFCFGNSDFT